MSPDSLLPLSVAAIVAVAALLSVLPSTSPESVVGAQGASTPPRLAVNGGVRSVNADLESRKVGRGQLPTELFRPVELDANGEVATAVPGVAASATPSNLRGGGVDSPVPIQDDGTLVMGYAPDTTVEDGARFIRRYTVRKGDTLGSVAKRFGVSKPTVYWANNLRSQALKPGLRLQVPPVSGLIYTVEITDTLEALARRLKINPQRVVTVNGLADSTLVVGQVLVLPGVKLASIPAPKVASAPRPSSTMRHGWPLPVRGLLTTTFSGRHPGIDLAAPSGTPVRAIDAGRVVWAGWKNNGGGYVVVLKHPSGMTSTYNHNREVLVRVGATVRAGQRVASVGSTGISTGPHLDLRITMRGVFIDPLRILRR